MDVIWLVQSNMRTQTTFNKFQQALISLNIEFLPLPLVPFSEEIPEIKRPLLDRSVVCWGPGFVPRALNFPNLSPGIWYDDDNFRWSRFSLNWKGLMMSPHGEIMSLETAIKKLTSDPIFIRPDADNKAFTGAIFSRGNEPKPLPSFSRDFPVVVAQNQYIEHEWRFIIVDKKIISASSYRIAGFPNIEGSIPEAAIDIAETALNMWCPADVFCLDIGYNGERYGIIEVNCFNASRLYNANPIRVVSAVTEFVVK